MFKNLTDSQKGWLMITAVIVEAIVVSEIVSYCNKCLKIEDKNMKWLMEIDEFDHLMHMIKD